MYEYIYIYMNMEGTFELDHPPLEVISVIKGHIIEVFFEVL